MRYTPPSCPKRRRSGGCLIMSGVAAGGRLPRRAASTTLPLLPIAIGGGGGGGGDFWQRAHTEPVPSPVLAGWRPGRRPPHPDNRQDKAVLHRPAGDNAVLAARWRTAARPRLAGRTGYAGWYSTVHGHHVFSNLNVTSLQSRCYLKKSRLSRENKHAFVQK